ncbi:MAG: 50S ribosomal protein L11 methyltransferase [Cyanobacteria bacterium]|nr:50S ribosomal protein L11 methyltransferase [Cyanobacteriota bacterium]
MPCEEFVIECPPEAMSYLGERLWGLEGVLGVMEDYQDEVFQRLRVMASTGDAAEILAEEINAVLESESFVEDFSLPLGTPPCVVSSRRVIQDEEWAESWKRFWHVQPITDKLVIRPTWEPYTPKSEDEVVIDLDPGSAFGTGTHGTTRLMLRAIEAFQKDKKFSDLSVLDIGTGSGILAIYAAKLGCRSVMGLDVDPMSILAANENVVQNNVTDSVTISQTPLGELCRTPYDLILANILAPVILELLPEMLIRLIPGGTLIASGLIQTSVGSVQSAMEAAGFVHCQQMQEGEWFAVRGQFAP